MLLSIIKHGVTSKHLSVTQHGIWTWGLYVSIENMWGYCIKNPTMDPDIHPERHISAGIVLPSTSASFCLNFCVFFEKIKFFEVKPLSLGYVSYG